MEWSLNGYNRTGGERWFRGEDARGRDENYCEIAPQGSGEEELTKAEKQCLTWLTFCSQSIYGRCCSWALTFAQNTDHSTDLMEFKLYTIPRTPLTPSLRIWIDLAEKFAKEFNTVLIFTLPLPLLSPHPAPSKQKLHYLKFMRQSMRYSWLH